jgi:protein-L-isoaspartate O-methyltransferase
MDEAAAFKELGCCSIIVNEFALIKRLKEMESKLDSESQNMMTRLHFIERVSFAVPTATAILEIKKFVGTDKLLEVGAGKAYWAWLLNHLNVDVLSTDIKEQPTALYLLKKLVELKRLKSTKIEMF